MATSNFGSTSGHVANFPIEIDIRGFRTNADLIRESTFRLARQLGDMRIPLTTSVNKVIIPSMDKNFMVQGRPTWPPVDTETLVRKFRTPSEYNAALTLIRTGKMYETITAGHYWRITRETADMEQLDNVVKYAKFHQSGTKKMPQRQFALLQQQDVERIVVIFDSWIRFITSQKDFWPYDHKEF